MLQLRVFGDVATLDEVGTWLKSSGHGEHTVVTQALHDVHSGLLTTDVDGEAAQDVLAHLDAAGVGPKDVALVRVEDISPTPPGSRAASLIWPDMVGLARRNARPLGRYLVFMAVAGIIAGYGVITINDTLIVGAMAVSPDTLPLVSACVGIVGGRWLLAVRAIGTLALGLAVTGLAASAVGIILDVTHGSSTFSATSPGLTSLVTIGFGTIGVALAAGVAAMLALETRASSAVGVAISVTTIPAAAYFGVAVAVNQYGRADGALAVLGVNVAMLLVGGTATLAVQRWFYQRPAAATPARRDADG
jgi:uncharacterized hydrophobic protein (TIGR00271 family)